MRSPPWRNQDGDVSKSIRRRAERVPVGLPARLKARNGFIDAQVQDLSRGGLRMRVTPTRQEMDGPLTLPAAADWVSDVLTSSFSVNLHHHKLGPLLQNLVKISRLGVPSDAPNSIEPPFSRRAWSSSSTC